MDATAGKIFSIQTTEEFNQIALEVFRFQAAHCEVYAKFLHALGCQPALISDIGKVPCLPVSFFKNHRILSSQDPVQTVFSSSATTGMVQSKHYITDLSVYNKSFKLAFRRFYGLPENFRILALLPSYQEREGSSLIYMVDELIRESNHPESGYFLHENDKLFDTLSTLQEKNQPTLLIGVTYALLDFIDRFSLDFPDLIVMETGGMKGKRPEIVRETLHKLLCRGFGVDKIHSEYGMTELLSQAYSNGNGLFSCPPWMQIKLRDINDPLSYVPHGKTGGINVIDLANIHSCAFLATQDLGRIHPNNQFEVLGRFDDADIRGCNLLVQ